MSDVFRFHVHFLPGTRLQDAVKFMLKLAREYHCEVSTDFNGVILSTNHYYNGLKSEDELIQEYDRKIKKRITRRDGGEKGEFIQST